MVRPSGVAGRRRDGRPARLRQERAGPQGDRGPTAEPLDRRRLLRAAGLAAVCTALLWLRTDHLTLGSPYFVLPWDHHMYIAMAVGGPLDFHVAPYAWRILGPALVWAMPFGAQLGFQIVTLVCVWGTGVAVWALLARLGFRPELCTAGLLLSFSLGYATKWTVFDFWLTDPLAFLLATTAVLLVLSGRDLAFAVCLAVGVLAKESVIFVAPLAYTLRARRPWDRALALRTLGATLPAIGALVAVHLGIPERNADPAYVAGLPRAIRENTIPHYTYGSVLHHIVARRLDHWPQSLVRTVSAFGVATPVLAAIGLRSPRARSFALRALPFLALVLVQLLFAYNTERLLVLGLVAAVPLAVWGFEQLIDLRGSGLAACVTLAGVLFLVQLAGMHEWEPNPLVQLAVLAVFVPFVGPWRVGRGRRRRRNEPAAVGDSEPTPSSPAPT
ncbi:MAG: hypothetical protein ACJ77A_09475 [Actinomycetota bacterium]